jgi:hypothetical protein
MSLFYFLLLLYNNESKLMLNPIESQTQNRIIKMFAQQSGYVYYCNWEKLKTKLIR